MSWTVRIDRTWDGAPIPEAEQATLELALDEAGLEIAVDAPWHGDPVPSGPPGPRAALWEHEVVELFLVGLDAERRRYTEIELGPHGHHLVLRLAGVRQPVATELPLDFEAAREGARWKGRARIDRALLPDPIVAFNAYAIHGTGSERRYLAHAPVPGDGPDFHRLQHFPTWFGDDALRGG